VVKSHLSQARSKRWVESTLTKDPEKLIFVVWWYQLFLRQDAPPGIGEHCQVCNQLVKALMLPIRHSVLSWMSLANILLVLTCYLPVVKGFGHKHHPNHHHLHHRRASDKALLHNATTSGNGKGSSIDATLAAKMIAQAHEAMAVANRLRLENIQYNRYEFLNSTSAQRSSTPAPPLDYTAVTSNRTVYRRNNHANSSYTNSTNFRFDLIWFNPKAIDGFAIWAILRADLSYELRVAYVSIWASSLI
jgi:hypothetical protein